MIRSKVVFPFLLIINLNQVHSESRTYEIFYVQPAYKITEVPNPNPNEETVKEYCGWETEAEVRRACWDILRFEVFEFNNITFEEGKEAQPMKKYHVQKSRMWFGTKEIALCKCPATSYPVYMSSETSNVNALDVYVERADFVSEEKRLKLLSKQTRKRGFDLSKDFKDQNCCECTATVCGILMYPFTCCYCFHCCGKFR